MAEKTIYKALFAAARVAARTLILQPDRIKADLARKAVGAAAQEIGKAVGRAAASASLTMMTQKPAQVSRRCAHCK